MYIRQSNFTSIGQRFQPANYFIWRCYYLFGHNTVSTNSVCHNRSHDAGQKYHIHGHTKKVNFGVNGFKISEYDVSRSTILQKRSICYRIRGRSLFTHHPTWDSSKQCWFAGSTEYYFWMGTIWILLYLIFKTGITRIRKNLVSFNAPLLNYVVLR